MRKVLFLLAALAAVALGVGTYLLIGDSERPSAAYAHGPTAKAVLRNAAGDSVGSVQFQQLDSGKVLVQVQASDLPAGFHGFHVHAVGNCTPGTSTSSSGGVTTKASFLAAGGHFNPGGQTHPSHVGDMPVLLVNGDGTAAATFETDRYTVTDLFDSDGSALIVHVKPDNYANIPTDRYGPDPDATTLATGDAGGRLACGLIEAN